MSGGKPGCMPPEIMTSDDASTPPQPLKVTEGMTSNVARGLLRLFLNGRIHKGEDGWS